MDLPDFSFAAILDWVEGGWRMGLFLGKENRHNNKPLLKWKECETLTELSQYQLISPLVCLSYFNYTKA